MSKMPFIADPRYSNSDERQFKAHEQLREDISMTDRQPYPQEHEINLPRLKMSVEGMPFIDEKDYVMSIN